ncbi:MAG: molybdopterin synthase sulfur carrier subunit [Gemmatimonadetes bacterium]|nr:molybdopterin synthase sulfur carrier subunit [Gemmatimonadota bacterium]|tara:strand:- start:909 stop:1172 length:264 start_codon:yes stop_codon:yes gene_type:complete
MPVVWIPSLMRSLTDGKEQVPIEGETLRAVIEALESDFPGFKARVIDEDRIRPGLAVSINGEVTNEGLRQKVGPNDEVHFVAAISGG